MRCGHEVRPMLSNLHQGAGPCTNCAQPGLNLTAPTALYVVAGRGILKAGITNLGRAEKQRMGIHRRNGLDELVARYEFETGFLAREAESIVVTALVRAAGDVGRVSAADLPDGFTEAVKEDVFPGGRSGALALIETVLDESDTGVMRASTDN